MTKIVLSDNATNASWLEDLLTFYLNSENIKKNWKDFSFRDADNLARLLAKYLDIEADAEKSPFDEIAQKILDFLSREDFEASSKIPPQIQELVREYEEALIGQEEKNLPAIARQKAAQKVQAFLEYQQKLVRNQKIVEELAVNSVQKLNTSPLRPDIPEEAIFKITAKLPEIAGKTKDYSKAWRQAVEETVQELQKQEAISETQATFLRTIEPPTPSASVQETVAFNPEQLLRITEVVVASLETDENLQILLEKTASQEEQTKAWQGYIERTYTQKIAPVLEKEGLPVQVETLIAIEPPLETMTTILAETKKAPETRTNTTDWFTAQVSPAVLSPEETGKLIETLIPVIAANLPETKPETVAELKQTVRDTIVVSLAQVAPELIEKGIALSPAQAEQIISRLIPSSAKEIENILTAFSLPQSERSLLLEKPGEIKIEIISVRRLTAPSYFGNPLLVRTIDEKGQGGATFVEQLQNIITQKGVNQGTVPQLKELIEEIQCLSLTAQGITPADLEHAEQKLLTRGLKPDAPEIKEIRELKTKLASFQEKAPETVKKQQNANRQSTEPVRVLFSNNATLIERKTSFKLPRFPNFLSKIFGNKGLFKNRFVFIGQTRATIMKQYGLIRSQIASRFKNWFFATGLGKTVKLGLEKVGQKTLQGLLISLKTGTKKVIISGLGKIGISATVGTALGGPIGTAVGTVVGWIGEKIIKGGLNNVKKGLNALLSLGGLGDSVLSGLTGGREIKEDINLKWLLLVFILFFTIAPFLVFFNFMLKGQAFIRNVSTPFRVGSAFIDLSKTVTPSVVGNDKSPPYTFDYEITITAKEKKLTEIKISDKLTLLHLDQVTDLSSVVENPPLPSSIDDLEPGAIKTINYKITINQKLTDALLVNEITVSGKVDLFNKSAVVTAVVTIGNPTGCFTFPDPNSWDDVEMEREMDAITKILSKTKYVEALCQDGPIEIIRERGRDWCQAKSAESKILITDRCISSKEVALYGLAHESGHIFARRNNNIYHNFINTIKNSQGILNENLLCSYPIDLDLDCQEKNLSSQDCLLLKLSEDFSETIAVYFTNFYYPGYRFLGCHSQPLILANSHLEHYNFIKPIIETIE